MDQQHRQITKIARNAQLFTSKALMNRDLGLSEYEFIHAIKKSPGMSQTEISNLLHVDKAAITRRCSNLVKKGYIRVELDEHDKRAKKLYITEKAQFVKDSKNEMEAFFYDWLLHELNHDECEAFLKTLNQLYLKSKSERKANFSHCFQQLGKHDEAN